MFFPSLIQYVYQGGIFLLPVTQLSLKPAILKRKEQDMTLEQKRKEEKII